MRLKSTFVLPAAILLSVGLSPILPIKAQENGPPVRARAIIRTPDGERVIDLDPSTLPDLGDGKHVIIMRAGPNGEISTFAGNPDMLDFSNMGGISFGGPGMGGANRGAFANLNLIDPGTSYLYALLKRIDVGSEIRLNARQREALEAAEKNQQEARQQQMKEAVGQLTQNLQNKSPEELKSIMQERSAKMQEQSKNYADSRMKTLATILKPEQLARLKELDLQYRGPMAMGVNEIATLATLNREQSATVAGILKEYRQGVNKALGVGTRLTSFKPGSAPAAAPPAAPNSEEERVRLVKAEKEIRKSRQALGAKALGALADPQRAQWSKLTGKPFEFHPAL
jgi:hypothetical protein